MSVFNVMKRLDKIPKAFLGKKMLKTNPYNIPVMYEEELRNLGAQEDLYLVNGIGSTGSLDKRKKVFLTKKSAGFVFQSIIDPSAVLFENVDVGEGVQLMAGVIVCNDVEIGENSIINTGAVVEHDCRIGKHCHIAPGATLSGGVIVGDETHVGAGATLIQNVILGNRCTVAAGAVVVSSFSDDSKVFGIPAMVR